MFDALEDCPKDFQAKLIQVLNSVGETIQASPADVFNIVLCASNDENDKDVTKKMYNWWKAVFEILSKCEIPDDRKAEYDDLVDTLMAEVSKAGDDAQVNESNDDVVYIIKNKGGYNLCPSPHSNGDYEWDSDSAYAIQFDTKRRAENFIRRNAFDSARVVEIQKSRLMQEEYEQANIEDEEVMLKDMEFAISKIGEIANRVQDLINFVNPYCQLVKESSGEFYLEDVREDYLLGRITDEEMEDAINGIEDIYEDMKPEFISSLKELKDEFMSYVDAANSGSSSALTLLGGLVSRLKITTVFGFDKWWDKCPLNKHNEMKFNGVDESINKFNIGDIVDWYDPEDGTVLHGGTIVGVYDDDTFKVDFEDEGAFSIPGGDLELSSCGHEEFNEDNMMKFKNIDESGKRFGCRTSALTNHRTHEIKKMYISGRISEDEAFEQLSEIGRDDSTAEMLIDRWNSDYGINESNDGEWVDMDDLIGVPQTDPEDDVEEPIEDDNSEVGELEEVEMESDVKEIEGFKVGDKVIWDDPDGEPTDGWTIVDFEFEYPDDDEFDSSIADEVIVDIEKEDGSYAQALLIELEHDETQVDEAKVVQDVNDVWALLKVLEDDKASKNLKDLIDSHVRSEEEIMDAVDELYPEDVTQTELNNVFASGMEDIVDALGLDVNAYVKDGSFVDLSKPSTIAAEGDEESKPEEVNGDEKKFKGDDGEVKTLDNANKKVVSEMTIEQDINSAEQLERILWGQGRENFIELVSKYGADEVMSVLEDSGITNLTQMNDYLWFEIDSIEEMLGGTTDDEGAEEL